jgi:sterol desaturase/sphingolipid hydroxylase (fatty acid hydroxylase superfamily)
VVLNAAVALLVLGVCFLPLEKLWPAHRGQRFLRPGFRTDVAHFLFTGTLTTLSALVAAVPIVLLIRELVPDSFHTAITSQPAPLQLVEALLILEVVGYWSHRAMHTFGPLWRLHRVHHSSERLDWLAAAHLHPFDAGLGRVLAVIPLALLGFGTATFGGALVLLQLHAIFQHANFRVGFGPLRGVIASPQFHHWHHTNDVDGRDHNFAGLFPWLDSLFGTRFVPADRRAWPETYGVDGGIDGGWFRQLASPFRRPAPAVAAVPLGTCVPPSAPPTSTSPRWR